MVARREWTRQFWAIADGEYDMITSPAVMDELSKSVFPGQQDAIALISVLPLVPLEREIADIVSAYIQHKVMPADPSGDALHLALASYHKCDFLLTWNCNHLANANKFGHIRSVNVMLGLFVPMLVTPLELLGERYES
jgi:predicted nucleic acid-binding protein